MDIDNLTVGELKRIAALPSSLNGCSATQVKEKHNIGQKVIVRCRDAGVHFGTLIDYNGREVVLSGSRRMWHWYARSGHTLSGCAIHGVKDNSKIAGKITGNIVLPEACEIIPCTEDSIKSIESQDEYNN